MSVEICRFPEDAPCAYSMTYDEGFIHVLANALPIHEKHGYFQELLVSKYFEGQSGLATMKGIMSHLRKNPPTTITNQAVVRARDYLDGTTHDTASGERTKDIDLPSSNVLQFFLSDGTVLTVRPSGTEPKIKFYASCRGEPGMPLDQARKIVGEKIVLISQFINVLAA